MQLTVKNITYELREQPKESALKCCEGCAAHNSDTLKCWDFKGLCSHGDNLTKVWKEVSNNKPS